ncbi:hypothetical protein LX64_00290 [Chitinophaga skermanii]|uniref:Uncharacterized protein n=1 Tax=Chitinophaga skermanii TaxID=331697 RepID=A0A327R4J3_9BACT|nr:hypothetical protein [Chitinophaga skermanii]RAJ10684.1 hypothetical protein LX64_00290 [Chitinophaga skermanii]
MKKLTFETGLFSRSLLVYIVLMLIWTFVNYTVPNMNGIVNVVVYMLIFAVSVLMAQKEIWGIFSFLYIFAISAFIICVDFIVIMMTVSIENIIIANVIHALYLSAAVTFFINRIYGIYFNKVLLVVLFFGLLAAFEFITQFAHNIQTVYNIHPSVTMLSIIITTIFIPVLVGMKLKPAASVE